MTPPFPRCGEPKRIPKEVIVTDTKAVVVSYHDLEHDGIAEAGGGAVGQATRSDVRRFPDRRSFVHDLGMRWEGCLAVGGR